MVPQLSFYIVCTTIGCHSATFVQQKLNENHLFYRQVKDDRSVKISHKSNFQLTDWLSKICNSTCFTLQKRLFCTVKA